MRKIHHKIEQLPLFSNIPFSTNIPNRAATKQENDFMVAIREGIQEYVNSGGDYSEPIVFEIDFRKMAALKGLSRWESLQRSYSRTLSKIKSMPLTQTVHYVTPDGEEKEETYWMLSKFTQNMTYIQIGKLHREGVKDINAGGYLQTLLKSHLPNATYKQMAVEIVLNAPEFRDEVIDKIAEYRSVTQAQELAITIDKNKKEPEPTPDNNDFRIPWL